MDGPAPCQPDEHGSDAAEPSCDPWDEGGERARAGGHGALIATDRGFGKERRKFRGTIPIVREPVAEDLFDAPGQSAPCQVMVAAARERMAAIAAA